MVNFQQREALSSYQTTLFSLTTYGIKILLKKPGRQQCDSPLYVQHAHMCWDTDSEGLNKGLGDTTWHGNSLYFMALIEDMMEFDNTELSTQITRYPSEFNLVFDESRHISSALSMPFTEAMGAIVLLTSDGRPQVAHHLESLCPLGHRHHGRAREGKLAPRL